MVDRNIEFENVQNYLNKTAAVISSKTPDTMAKHKYLIVQDLDSSRQNLLIRKKKFEYYVFDQKLDKTTDNKRIPPQQLVTPESVFPSFTEK